MKPVAGEKIDLALICSIAEPPEEKAKRDRTSVLANTKRLPHNTSRSWNGKELEGENNTNRIHYQSTIIPVYTSPVNQESHA
jgi:hypothetical protein